jgi:acyl-coenzyme A thioesterase PaaI-like protein
MTFRCHSISDSQVSDSAVSADLASGGVHTDRGWPISLLVSNMPFMTPAQMSIGEMLAATVPMVRTLNLEYLETTPERAVVRLPDQAAFHNHLGGPHAGAMFTLAESASGAIVLAAFGDQLTRAVPLAVRAEIGYKKLAKGPVTATATLGRPVADVVAELDAGLRPEFPVAIAIQRDDEAVTGEMTVVWTLRPNS